MRPRMLRRPVLGLSACLLAGACAGPDPDPTALVPELDPGLVAVLTQDDDGALRRFARAQGRAPLLRAASLLLAAPPTTSGSEFLRVETAIAPLHARLADVLASEFQDDFARRMYDAYARYPPADRMDIARFILDSRAPATDAAPPARVHAAHVLEMIERARRYPDVLNVADLYGVYASLLPALGRREEIPVVLRHGIESALEFRDFAMACQLLGTLGYHHQLAGDIEDMRECWDRALDYARRAKSWQEARILSFYAAFYRSRGQVAIARDLLLEAQDRCRELGASEAELRFVIDATVYFAELGCWDVVGQGLRRADLVLAESCDRLSPVDLQLEETRLDALRAGHRASLGQRQEARVLATAAAARTRGWPLGPHRAVAIKLQAARALSMAGSVGDARALLEETLHLCREVPIPEQVEPATLALADAYLAGAEPDSCEMVLTALPPSETAASRLQRCVLRLRLSISRGDREAAVMRLQEALALLDAWLAEAAGSAEDDIALALHDDLRQLGHHIFKESPEAGYAFELRWRTPLRRGARFGPSARSAAGFIAGLERSAREDCARLAARNAIHCIYDVRGERIVRFTAGANGVARVALPADPGTIRAHVATVCEAISRPASESSAARRASAAIAARALGGSLLPPALLDPSGPELVLFTANGWLERLPFETLDVGSNDTVPLLALRDVARVRHWQRGPGSRATGDELAIVVSEPSLSRPLRRRYSILAEALPRSAAEAAYACSLLPRAVALSGDRATKSQLVARWESARLLYFAGHVIQDPDVPWVSFIPVAQATDAGEDDSYLEASDIRSADLRRCGLVVLSSCGSGAPYAAGGVSAPSLADAFLDAGVQAVVSTGWAVLDAAADRTMQAFMREVMAGGEDPIRALCRLRRQMARQGADPHTWAVYSISTRSLAPAGPWPLTPRTRPDVAAAR